MYCKTCGNVYEDPNATSCARCGAPRGAGNSYCENCGSPVSPGQANCVSCGRPVNGNAGGYQQNYYQGYNPNNNNNAYNNAAYNNPMGYQQNVPPIKYRNVVACVIFSFITCGIYGLYWFVQLTEDANALSNDHKTSGGIALLLNIVTCSLYGIYWAYRQGEKLDYAKQSRGIRSSDSPILYLILQVVGLGLIGEILMQVEINKFAKRN